VRDALSCAKVMIVDRPLDPILGVTEFISDWIKRHGFYPTFQFNNVSGSPGFRLIMNLLKRDILLQNMNVTAAAWLRTFAERLQTSGSVQSGQSLARHQLSSMYDLPVLQHQPRDKGRYLTSFVGCLKDPSGNAYNLGFYRALVTDALQIVLSIDPRTDAHRIVSAGLQQDGGVPITLFNGGPLCCYLAAAAKLPDTIDSFDAAARLQGRALRIDQSNFPPAPVEAEVVIRGVVTERRLAEAPFGEFKGYYCAPSSGPAVDVQQIHFRQDPYYLGLFCGKESGLTLMSMQNEFLLFSHLRKCGFEVGDVHYPLRAFGEFFTLIETPSPSLELLDAAMEFDQRSKVFIVGEQLRNVAGELSIFPFQSRNAAYVKRGRAEGERIGVVCRRSVKHQLVEY
jgi:2,5-furandicarboxylate decarboxylase 1